MDEQTQVYEFLIESIIPGFRHALSTRRNNRAVELIVNRVHRDVMIGARYKRLESSRNYCDNNKCFREYLGNLLIKNVHNLSGRGLIIKMLELNKSFVNIGLIQKLVNMSMKYLYVIDNLDLFENTDFHPNIIKGDCDCPLDSKVLDMLHRYTGKKYTALTKLNDVAEYESIQKDIEN